MAKIYLSRRNLQTLLNKLDRQATGEDTACSIVKYKNPRDPVTQTMDKITITAVEDEVLYANRLPGPIHPKDEPKRNHDTASEPNIHTNPPTS